MNLLHLVGLVLPCFAGAPLAAANASTPEPTAVVQETPDEADALHERLVAEYQKAKDKINEEWGRLGALPKEEKDFAAMDALVEESNAVIAQIMGAAETYAGTEGAVRFLIWRVAERPSSGPDAEAVAKALATLQASHIKSQRLKEMLPILGSLDSRVGADDAAAFMAALEKHSPVPELKAIGKHARLVKELESCKYGTEAYEKLSKEALAAAKATRDDRRVQEVERVIALASKFSIGMVAPDIEGIDLSGDAFKLSDYEGKVVFLDFWGDW